MNIHSNDHDLMCKCYDAMRLGMDSHVHAFDWEMILFRFDEYDEHDCLMLRCLDIFDVNILLPCLCFCPWVFVCLLP